MRAEGCARFVCFTFSRTDPCVLPPTLLLLQYGSGGGVVSLSEEDEDEDAAGDGKKDMPQRRSGQTKEDEYDVSVLQS